MSFLSHFKFQRLQWKLTLYYICITIIVLLVLEIIAIILFFSFVTFNKSRVLEFQVGIQAQVLATNFNGPFMDRNNLKKSLEDWPVEIGMEFEGYSMVIDPEGEVMAISKKGSHDIDISSELPKKARANVQRALTLDPSEAREMRTYSYEQGGVIYIVAPLANEKDVRGTLVLVAQNIQLFSTNFWKGTYQIFGLSIVTFLFGAAIVGVAFGIFTSRSLVRRIRGILTSTDQWSKGDFTTFVEDSSNDELGQLSQRLNEMARQLHHLLQVQQELAALEERNRLARELHDSVKQELFTLSIWLNTSKSFLEKDEQSSREYLMKAEQLLHHIQAELSALIHKLRPVELEGKNLSHALANYITLWQEQSGISVKLEISGYHPVSPIIEAAYFRITQEALSNVARHSKASLVTIHLVCEEVVILSIQDNGTGFDIPDRAYSGIGLSSMYERVHKLNGQINIQSAPGDGVSITVQCEQTGVPNVHEKEMSTIERSE
ncbi:hypothetical protein J14TS2_38090 [Bacillus sp. J14TS2]|uniref:sensor histidine kinase n=1 Tax=Bacillus sp. J14TS2 TaxID=2807188 RepID=UPI001B1FD7B4|nr:histidine kinase [Bacillus sp. J14TS2]GIN73334.1 hypothetical protein J14TS2_38090 [Bacillus sp. J14TS2]